MRHTEGPWAPGGPKNGYQIRSRATGEVICELTHKKNQVWADMEQRSNTRLICHAPDLLLAIHQALSELCTLPYDAQLYVGVGRARMILEESVLDLEAQGKHKLEGFGEDQSCSDCGANAEDVACGQKNCIPHQHEWSGYGDDGEQPCYCLICGRSGDV
jgi:hypothetical protein